MKIRPVQNVPRLHTTPLASVRVKDSQVIVDVDDEREKRFSVVFKPYQAMRMITADCFAMPDDAAILSNTVMEVLDSSWIGELTKGLKRVDETAKFMDQARHFILPLQDDFLEVVAWNIGITDPIDEEKMR
ncbi:MAG: hypothetical protein DMF69_06175 [Acidobacteria bacterium]|nr:MAG: hypothetical protein DMF69_06175 [Acidobacteriota bacterium]